MFRLPTIFVTLVILLAMADFHRWIDQVSGLTPAAAPKGDAIVALTGGSGHRISAALKILESGAGKRLLVSGVHESVDVEALIHAAGGTITLYDCCIDFGRSARSTQGNAIETAEWVEAHAYQSIIVVTSDYHMPRSLLWFNDILEGVDVIPYPVESAIRPRQWWTSWTSIKGLVLEWSKYRVTWMMKATGK